MEEYIYSEEIVGGYSTETITVEGKLMIKRINPDESISWIPPDLANKDYQEYLEWKKKEKIDNGT
jgi:hypothetical protein